MTGVAYFAVELTGEEMDFTDFAGERGRNRTYNLVIKSHLLCQLSYAPA